MSNEEEVWKDIPNWEGYYQASSLGRIRSLDRLIGGRYGNLRKIKGQIRKPCLNTKGYPHIGLGKNDKLKTYLVHILVAETFHKKPNYPVQVLHLNNIKTDSRSSNLKWGTNVENMADAKRDGLMRTPFGWERPSCRFDKSKYKEVYDLYNAGGHNKEQISKLCGLSSGHVFKMLKTYVKYKEEIDGIMFNIKTIYSDSSHNKQPYS